MLRIGTGPGRDPRSSGERQRLRAARLRWVPKGGDRYELRLGGELPASWSLRLCRNLETRRMNLLRGFGRRLPSGSWAISLEVDTSLCDHGGLDASVLDDIPVRSPQRLDPPLLDFWIERTPPPEGALAVEVAAWDAIGLLGSVLDVANRIGLEPVEILLETQEECAFHRLLLVGSPGRPPTGRQERELERALAARVGPG